MVPSGARAWVARSLPRPKHRRLGGGRQSRLLRRETPDCPDEPACAPPQTPDSPDYPGESCLVGASGRRPRPESGAQPDVAKDILADEEADEDEQQPHELAEEERPGDAESVE